MVACLKKCLFIFMAVISGFLLFVSNSQILYAAAPAVNPNIFKWVQSSARMTYYFNQQQICFKNGKDGIDYNTLVVPVLKTYDDIMINDIVSKRRWRMLSLDGFDSLVGSTEYVEVNLIDMTVHISQIDFIDHTWYAFDSSFPNVTLDLNTMSDKALDKKFYDSVIDFALRNKLELANRTRSDITPEMQKLLQEQQDKYILACEGGAALRDAYAQSIAVDESDQDKNSKDKDKKYKKQNDKDKNKDKKKIK